MTGTGTEKTATLFTPESANRALPYVRVVVKDLVEAVARLKRSEILREKVLTGHPSGGRTPEEREQTLRRCDDEKHAAREVYTRVFRELEAVGVEVKDAEIGLIDFPGELQGRRVLLCWKHGEERVAWWHDLDQGYRGRRPLPSPGTPGAPAAP